MGVVNRQAEFKRIMSVGVPEYLKKLGHCVNCVNRMTALTSKETPSCFEWNWDSSKNLCQNYKKWKQPKE